VHGSHTHGTALLPAEPSAQLSALGEAKWPTKHGPVVVADQPTQLWSDWAAVLANDSCTAIWPVICTTPDLSEAITASGEKTCPMAFSRSEGKSVSCAKTSWNRLITCTAVIERINSACSASSSAVSSMSFGETFLLLEVGCLEPLSSFSRACPWLVLFLFLLPLRLRLRLRLLSRPLFERL